MVNFLLLIASCFLAIAQWETDVKELDQAITQLSNMRDSELAKAARYQNQGDRLQFNTHDLIDARRYWNQADESRALAAEYQVEIDKLETKKAIILKQHGMINERPAN